MNLTAASLAGVRWADNGRRVGFAAVHPGYGVRRRDGRWLSFGGDQPFCVARKATALEVASTSRFSGTEHWIEEL